MEFYKEVILKSGDKIVLRNADMQDVRDFTIFTNKLFKETENFTRGKLDEDVTEEMQANYISKHLQSPNGLLLLVELDKKIIGHAQVEQKSNKVKLKQVR